MRAIIACGLYTFYPLLEVHLCTATFVWPYVWLVFKSGLQMARIRYQKAAISFWYCLFKSPVSFQCIFLAPLAINALTLVTLSTGYCLDDNCDDFSDDAMVSSVRSGRKSRLHNGSSIKAVVSMGRKGVSTFIGCCGRRHFVLLGKDISQPNLPHIYICSKMYFIWISHNILGTVSTFTHSRGWEGVKSRQFWGYVVYGWPQPKPQVERNKIAAWIFFNFTAHDRTELRQNNFFGRPKEVQP